MRKDYKKMIKRLSIILGVLFFYDISVFAGKAPRDRRALFEGKAPRIVRLVFRPRLPLNEMRARANVMMAAVALSKASKQRSSET